MLGSITLDLAAVAAPLNRFDRIDLAQRVGALQLMPENAANAVRLEVAGSVISTLANRQRSARISESGWRRWLRYGPLGESRVRSLEDPPCNPFTETIAFYGGSYVVLPGASERAASHLQTMLQAIFVPGLGEPHLNDQFVDSVRRLTLAALTLSHNCIEQAGLGRNETAADAPTEELVQPRAHHRGRLRKAVTFAKAELDAHFLGVGASIDDLSPLVMGVGSGSTAPVNVQDLPVFYRPILRVDDRYVLLAPSSLAAALTHAIMCKAHACGDLPALAERLRRTWFEKTDRALERLGCTLVSAPRSSDDPAFPSTQALYRFDADKLLALILLADPLDNFDPAIIEGEWSTPDVSEAAQAELLRLEERVASRSDPPNGLLTLISIASPGRRVQLGLPRFSFAKPLVLPPNDVEVIAHTERTNPLLLWQYAKASDRLRDSATVFCSNPLDELAFWRLNGFTYYMSDEAEPKGVLIAPGTAVDIRSDARDALDLHALPAPTGPGVVEVERYQNQDVPIYVSRSEADAGFALAVDGLPLTLWIKDARSPQLRRFRGLMADLIEFVSYWVWQFQEHLTETLAPISRQLHRLVLEVDFAESDQWFAEGPLAGEPLDIERTASGLKLTFREGAAALLAGSDNAGERVIVRIVLEALHDLRHEITGEVDRASGREITEAIADAAPLGLKKKILLLGGDAGVFLDESGLPPYRPLQPAATEEWRDREWLFLDQLNLPLGAIPDEKRVHTLNGMVERAFNRFEHLVAAANPAGLMENLVGLGERLIWQEERQRRLLPTQIACYSTVPQMVEELKQDGSTLASTAIAHRFVTEYIVARPPSGLRPMSLELYDELIALAALIVQWGRRSDALRYELADTELSVLKSGRLGVFEPRFESAVEDFGERFNFEQVALSTSAFSSMFRDPMRPAHQPLIDLEELDRATKAEFSVSITEVASFIHALTEIGSEQDGAAKRFPETRLRQRLLSALDWGEERVDAAFRLLSLGSRSEYLQPPEGFERRDLYPWAFSRRLSHLSRPVLLRDMDDGSREAIWGTKSLARTNEYLFRQIVEGRFKATSGELRSVQGRIANVLGERFNDRVADLYEANAGLLVHRRVGRFGSRRIERKRGEPLGDIDVLVADQLSRELLLVETKDFSTARTPAEFALEEKKLLATLRIHDERFEWVRENLVVALQWLGVSNGDVSAWRVEQVVVVSSEAFTPGLRDLPVPIKSLSTLRTEVGGAASDMLS